MTGILCEFNGTSPQAGALARAMSTSKFFSMLSVLAAFAVIAAITVSGPNRPVTTLAGAKVGQR